MKIFFQIVWVFVEWLKYPILFVFFLVALFFVLVYLNVFIGLLQGKRFKKGTHNKVKKKSIFRRLFIDLPYRISDDMFNRDPEEFGYEGLIIFEGRQGDGKTIAMMEFSRRMQQEYLKAKCLCNIDYSMQDEELDDWRKLVEYKNGKYGVIGIMDETQNWFSSNQSKDFPPEMLQTITQNRKNRRIILRYCSKLLFTCKGYSFTGNRSPSLYDVLRCLDNSPSSKTNFEQRRKCARMEAYRNVFFCA